MKRCFCIPFTHVTAMKNCFCMLFTLKVAIIANFYEVIHSRRVQKNKVRTQMTIEMLKLDAIEV